MSITRADVFGAVLGALRKIDPRADPGEVAAIGAEACLLALAANKGRRRAAEHAYRMADDLVDGRGDR